MTGAPTLHDVLRDLAEDVPVPSVVDSALRTARTRRLRRLVIAPALVVAALAAAYAIPDLVRATGVDQRPIAPVASAASYDPNVETPWPFLRDLPDRVDEPLALAYADYGLEPRVVGASGHQWRLADAHSWITPAIAPGGHRIAWYDSGDQELVLQDTAAGIVHRIPATFSNDEGTIGIAPEFALHWSPDSAMLGITTFEPSVVIIDFETAEVIASIPGRAQVVGWRDPDTMVALAQDPTAGGFTDLLEIDTDGTSRSTGEIASPGDGSNTYPLAAAVAPDGDTLAGVQVVPDLVAGVFAWDLDSGNLTQFDCAACSTELASEWASTWITDTELLVRLPDEGGSARFGAVDVETGGTREVFAFSPRMELVRAAVGPAVVPADHDQLQGPSWWGWYVDRISLGAGSVILTAILVMIMLRRRTRGGPGRSTRSGATGES